MRKTKYRVLLTGGHAATAALATIEEIEKRTKKKPWKLYWIGVERAIEGKEVSTLESKCIPRVHVEYYSIIAGRVQRKFTVWTIPSLLKIPLGFLNTFFLIIKIKPSVIVSFGGFASFPVVFIGRIFNIPIIIHEQTAAAGRANRMASVFAKIVALARRPSISYFPRRKCVVVGNPVREKILLIKPKKKIGNPATVFITGGSRGSVSINNFIEDILVRLLESFYVVHHTGSLENEKFNRIKRSLPENLKKRYTVHSSIDPFEIDRVFIKADIIISRAGANTVSEIMIVKRPAILIPLPFAYLNEQRKNAEFARKFGVSYIFDQEKESSQDLLDRVFKIKGNWRKIVNTISDKKSPDKKASYKLYRLIEKELK